VHGMHPKRFGQSTKVFAANNRPKLVAVGVPRFPLQTSLSATGQRCVDAFNHLCGIGGGHGRSHFWCTPHEQSSYKPKRRSSARHLIALR
jgi:hypothetical protein